MMNRHQVRILVQEESEYWQQFFAPFHNSIRCPQCGGFCQGMEALEPGSTAFDNPPNDAGFYRDNAEPNWMDSANALYQPCWQCNPREVIPAGFVPVTTAEAVAWDAKHGGPQARAYTWRMLRGTPQ
jgi:hypothetical protein